MKRGQTLLLLSIVLIGLTGTYLYLKSRPFEKVTPSAAVQAKTTVFLTKLDPVKIHQLVFKSAKADLTLVKQKGVWQSKPAQAYGLNQARIETAVTSFADLAAEIIDPQPHDLHQYGLIQPAVKLTIYVTGKANQPTIWLGDPTPTGDAYYAQRQGDPRVYAVAATNGESFRLSLNDLRDHSLPRFDPEQCRYFKLTRPGQRPIEIKFDPETDLTGVNCGLNNRVLTRPYQEPMGINLERFFTELLPSIANLQKQEYVDDHPANLAQYGLKPPHYDLQVKDGSDQTLHLLIGAGRDANHYYAKTADCPTVFTLDKTLNPILEITPFQLVNKIGYLVNIATVDKITIAVGTKEDTFTLTRRTKKLRFGREPAETDATYRMNGRPVRAAVFRTFYRSLIGLSFEADHQKQFSEVNPEVQITFYLNQGQTRFDRISYVSYNNEFYAVFHNGHSDFLISKDQVRTMLQDLEALRRGKLKARDI